MRHGDRSEDLGIDWSIILKWSSIRGLVRHGLACCGSGWGQVAGCRECGNEPSGAVKCGEFLD